MQCFQVLTIYIKTPGFKVSLWQEQNGFVGLSLLSSGQSHINPVLGRISRIRFVGQDIRLNSYSLNNITRNKNKPCICVCCAIPKHYKVRYCHQHFINTVFSILVTRIWKDTRKWEKIRWKETKTIRCFHVQGEWRYDEILPKKM